MSTTPRQYPPARRIGYPAPERSLAQLAVGASLAVLVLLLLVIAGLGVLLYFASDLLDMVAPAPIVRTPGT